MDRPKPASGQARDPAAEPPPERVGGELGVDPSDALSTIPKLARLPEGFSVPGASFAEAIRDETRTLRSEAGPTAAAAYGLPVLQLEDSTQGPAELRLEGTLGVGGMADVYGAVQTALGRVVAVKALKKDESRSSSAAALIREARLAGALEHPNIVPVYSLGMDAAGRPLLVMRRIKGSPWLDLMTSPADPPAWAPRDRLEWHLSILKQVCAAVHFAHSQGIVHRDIKPSNVMVGPFGEVYLLDWGIAVRLSDRPPAGVLEPSEVVGSPAYMAPEMLTGFTRDVDVRTDVYQLGATLHRIIAGTLRHEGDNAMAVWRHIQLSEPVAYPEHVPAELATIANKATHRDPTMRFSTAEAVRAALNDFLEHRSSVSLAGAAWARLAVLRRSLDQGAQLDDPTLYRALGECRFGFTQALDTWAENARARDGLQSALELTIEQELTRGNLEGARRLLVELPRPNVQLEGRVRFLGSRKAEDAHRLEQLKELERELDPELHRDWRTLLAAGGALIVASVTLAIAALDRAAVLPLTHGVSLGSCALMLAMFWGLLAGLRRWMMANRINRGLTYISVGASLWLLIHRLWAASAGVSPQQAVAADVLILGVATAAATVALDRRLWPSTAIYTAGVVGIILAPAWAVEVAGVASLAALGSIAVVWWGPPTSQ